jgi:predicted deacylase
MKLFNLESKKGEKVFGYVDMFEYPHGTKEKLPIVLIEGNEDGASFLLSGNIHGDEVHGLVTLQEVIKELDPTKMKGMVVIIPTLNPAGLLTLTRSPFYDRADPNRLWPDPKPKKEPKLKYDDPYDENLDPKKHPSIQESFYKKLAGYFDLFDFFIDLHCHSVRSFPYSYIDRVYYDDEKKGEKEKAQQLFDQAHEMVKAFGFTIVFEDPPKHYFRQDLHRSTTGSFLNKNRKPSFTVELGSSNLVDLDIVKAAKTAVLNVLKWSKIIDGEIEEIKTIPVLKEKLWREILVRTKESGFYIPVVKHGEIVQKDEPIAVVHDIFGEIKETILAPDYGTIMAFYDDIRCYPNSEIASFLVENTVDVICPWEYEEKEEKKEEKS